MIARAGGPEVLEPTEVDVGPPGAGELRLRQTAVGVNFHDIYVRSGQYPNVLPFPGIPGVEACGVVEKVGAGVQGFSRGDRVAYATSAYGAYSEVRLLKAVLAVKVPAHVEDAVAASLMVKGLTAAMLLFDVCSVAGNDVVLVQAAGGGVGRLLCQWASHLGLTVIGTAGSPEKMDLARRAGCRHVIDYRQESFVDAVREITGGQGVRIAYDSVGHDTFAGSLDCLAKRGHLVNFGQSSGPVAPITLAQLGAKSATLSRPVIFDYIASRQSLESMSHKVFGALQEGVISVDDVRRYPLEDAAVAHRDLEARALLGVPVLIP